MAMTFKTAMWTWTGILGVLFLVMIFKSMPSMASAPGGLSTFAMLLGAYFFPTIIAGARNHHNTLAIGIANLFLGWTFLGWIGALIWSCTSVRA